MNEASAAPVKPEPNGYTLVELLVVIAILGLLAVIATPQVIGYLGSAKISTAKTEIDSLSSALDLFRFDVGRYPTTDEGLISLVVGPTGVDSWHGPYVKRNATLNDPWGHPIHYLFPGEHGEFDMYSDGPNGATATTDEKPLIANW